MQIKTKAVLLMLFSAFSFACMGLMVKQAGNLPVYQKVFFRNLVSLFIAFYAIKRTNISLWGEKAHRPFLLLRSITGLLGVICYFFAIFHLNLADSAMLNKLSPFFVTFFAFLFLREKLESYQIVALIVVFSASLLIIKPKFDISILPGIAGFLSAVLAGASYTTVRYLGDKEKPATIVFFFSFISVIGILPFMLFTFVVPTIQQWIFLFATGIFAGIGQISLTYAYRFAPASEIAIYNYSSVIFSAILGFTFLSELSDFFSLLGIAIILLTSLFLFYRNRKRNAYSRL
jgi:drug/metabolite transporter (DMT)-like permease